MFKELQRIFQRKSLMEEAVEASHEMLMDDWDMYKEAVKSLRKTNTADITIDINEKDIQINKFEREVKKKVLTHLAVAGVSDLNVGLVLITIVADIERIGDYTKNIVELAINHPGKLTFPQWDEEIQIIEETISDNFGVLINAIKNSDDSLAQKLLDDLHTIKNKCDKFNKILVEDEKLNINVNDAVALALYMRYLKRVAGHLMNVATSIVNPFHKIKYRQRNG